MRLVALPVVLALTFVAFMFGAEWSDDAKAQTLPLPPSTLAAPVAVLGEDVPCSAFDMSATGFQGCPTFRIVQENTYHGLFYHSGGVDHFDPMLVFARSQGSAAFPTQVQTGERTTPIAVYYYVGPDHAYQQVGSLTWRTEGIGDCDSCLWGALDFYLADFTNQDPSTHPEWQRAAQLRARGSMIVKPGGDYFVGSDNDLAAGVFARLAALEARIEALENP